MATLKGANKTKIDAIKPSDILGPGLMGGKVRCMVDTYVGLGTETINDTIEMCADLPVGAKILFMVLRQNATGNTAHVGDAEDPNRYMDAAADNAVTMSNDVYTTGVGYEITDKPGVTPYDSQILVTILAGAVTLAGTMNLVVFYTVE